MIKSVTIINPFGDDPLVLNLPTSHEEHGLYIKSITGIGPDKATINTTSLAMEDGGIFNSAKADIRNIVINLGFYESSILHNSIEDSRHLTYKYFPKKKKVTLKFETDTRSLSIDGWIESNEPDIFNKEEETQISIICPDPNFHTDYVDDSIIGGMDGLFEFPFENETEDGELSFVSGLTKDNHEILTTNPSDPVEGKYYYIKRNTENGIVYDEKYCISDGILRTLQEGLILYTANIIVGENNEGTIHDIYYYGDSEIGMEMVIHFLGPTGNIEIQNIGSLETIHIDIDKVEAIAGVRPNSGDDIVLNTMVGQKSLLFYKGSDPKEPIDILNVINKDDFNICWFKLRTGRNRFVILTNEGASNIKINMKHYITYDGI